MTPEVLLTIVAVLGGLGTAVVLVVWLKGRRFAPARSVNIDTDLLFSHVLIETSGGASPIRCDGHRKADAVGMKALIEAYQTQYYRSAPGAGAAHG